MGWRTGRSQASQNRLREQLRFADRQKKQKHIQKMAQFKKRELTPWQRKAGARFIL